MRYHKLVRDRIPEIINEDTGVMPKIHIAETDEEYLQKLMEKLKEEVEEFAEDASAEELADILEVLDAIFALEKFDRDEVNEVKEKKAWKRGGFTKRIILDEA